MAINLKQLRYFLAVVEEQNVTKASNKLHISQPAISNAIKQLEESLNVDLLIRSHAQGISLTDAGRNLAAKARSLLIHADEVEAQVRDLGESLTGTLAIGCFTTLAPFLLPGITKRFQELYPQVALTIVEGNAEQLQQALLNGEIEQAIMYDLELSSKLDINARKSIPPYILVAKNHPLAKQKDASLKELADAPYILLDLPLSRQYFMSIFQAVNIQPNIALRTSNFELVRSMVAAEQGYSILAMKPHHSVTYYKNKQVSCLPIRDPHPSIAIVLASVKGQRLSRKAEVFSDVCSSFIGE